MCHPPGSSTRQISASDLSIEGTCSSTSLVETRSNALEGKVSGIAADISSPYLKEGKENFDQYITDNTIPVLDSSGKKLSANILLSFILNNKGTPSHIKVIESSCKPCETEAIRLLKNGPDWVGKRGTSGSVRIRF